MPLDGKVFTPVYIELPRSLNHLELQLQDDRDIIFPKKATKKGDSAICLRYQYKKIDTHKKSHNTETMITYFFKWVITSRGTYGSQRLETFEAYHNLSKFSAQEIEMTRQSLEHYLKQPDVL